MGQYIVKNVSSDSYSLNNVLIFYTLIKLFNCKKYRLCDQSEINGKKLKQLESKTISGRQLKQILKGMPLLKFMNDNDQHYGMKYQTGFNEDYMIFENENNCSKGGIYVTTLDKYNIYVDSYGDCARRVEIEDDAMIYVENNKLKCNKVILGPRKFKYELIEELFDEYMENKSDEFKIKLLTKVPQFCQFIELTESMIIDAMENNIEIFSHLNNNMMTSGIMMKAVQIDGNLIQIIDPTMRTPELEFAAVKQSYEAIKYIDTKNLTLGTITEIVEKNPSMIQYIDPSVITMELMMKIVKTDGMALAYFPKELAGSEICLEAVKQNGKAIQFVKGKNRTPEILFHAIDQDKYDVSNFISQHDIILFMKIYAKKE